MTDQSMNGAKRPLVAFCVPSSETWKASFGYAATRLGITSTLAGLDVVLVNERGGDAAENRNKMTALGLANKADWFLFADADMTFPPDALVRLLEWNVDVVGADYRNRHQPFQKLGLDLEAKRATDDPEGGLVERGILGLGLLLFRADVFRKMPAPWFARLWIPQAATPDNPFGFSTDDTYVCHYARHHGFKVWCDLGLTKEVRHIGEMEIPWDMPGA